MKKLFIDSGIEPLEQINSPTGRFYLTPEGNKYPSATTILSINDGPWLQEWKDRVGEEAAAEISRKATRRGTAIHEACEMHIIGEEKRWTAFEQTHRDMFQALMPVLDSIQEVYAMETRLYSDKLETAGTVDLICKIDGKITILDWKTASKYKNREDISNYFEQCAFYSFAFFERTGIAVPNITIAMTVEDHGLELYHEKVKTWLPAFIKTRQKFRELKGY
jgi:hypothetical protein